MAKIAREKFKTYGNVFDQFTLRNLFKLSSQGHFDELESPISIGKEANIFTAKREDDSRVIVKIYRLENCDFNRMYDYLKYDVRYTGLKSKRRDIIFAWAQREFRNLLKARQAGARVPLPITRLYNILVLEYLGDNGLIPAPAPKLKDKIPKDLQAFLDTVIATIQKMYRQGIVHGDLSEFNILNFNETPVIIDFSQGTTIESGNAHELLMRDIHNISRFFKKHGIATDETELIQWVMNEPTTKTTTTDKQRSRSNHNSGQSKIKGDQRINL
ncbi:serine protein kinase RIO [Candidatus Woesearchaeota archaeon]|nr:serine protein kinase RIO [Candidatus Woesearchaeota archaeon]